jgi:hypothetical protein
VALIICEGDYWRFTMLFCCWQFVHSAANRLALRSARHLRHSFGQPPASFGTSDPPVLHRRLSVLDRLTGLLLRVPCWSGQRD